MAVANRGIRNLDSVANTGIKGLLGVGAAFAALGASGVAAGAVASAAVAGITAGIGGALVYFAAKNQEVKDSFTSLKEHVSTQMQSLTAPLVEPLKQFASQARGAFDALAPSIANISAALAPVITQIGDKLTPLAEKLGPMLESAFNAGTGPLLAFLDGLGPVTDGFKRFFDILNRPEITEFVNTLMTSLGDLLPVVAELLVNLTPIGTVALPILVEVLKSLTDVLNNTVIPAMTTLGGFLADHPGLVMALAAAFVAIKVAVVAWNVAQMILNLTLLASPITWIILGIAALIAIIVLLVANWDTVSKKLGEIWDWIKNKASEVWNGIKNFFVTTWNSIKTTVLQAWENIKSSISNAMNTVRSTVVNMMNNVIGFILGLPGRFFQAGVDLIRGLINGVGSMAGALVSKAREVASGALNAIKSFFGIGSPSKVLRQIGVWVGEGFVIGLDREDNAVARAAKSLGTTALTEIKKAATGVNDLFESGFSGTARVAIEPGAGVHSQAPVTFTVNVQAGVGNPEEIGREVVRVIGEFERINGARWRE